MFFSFVSITYSLSSIELIFPHFCAVGLICVSYTKFIQSHLYDCGSKLSNWVWRAHRWEYNERQYLLLTQAFSVAMNSALRAKLHLQLCYPEQIAVWVSLVYAQCRQSEFQNAIVATHPRDGICYLILLNLNNVYFCHNTIN